MCSRNVKLGDLRFLLLRFHLDELCSHGVHGEVQSKHCGIRSLLLM